MDVKKDDGFAALHLACLNGHRAVAETLLAQGRAGVDLRNNRCQTPLLLAVSQVRQAESGGLRHIFYLCSMFAKLFDEKFIAFSF